MTDDDCVKDASNLGHKNISKAHGMIAIQELTARFDWFDTLGLLIMFNLTKKVRSFTREQPSTKLTA